MNLKNNLLTVRWTLTFIIGTIWSVFSCQAINPPFVIKHLGDGQSIVQIENQKKFLLLPVEEASPEAKLYMIADNDVVRNMNVRLAINKVDYFVPVDLSGFDDKSLSFNFQLIPDTAICWDEMKLSNEFDTSNRESFRPLYHFTPQYGWMNDPNGMVYKDGVYHLFYQYNPYGSMWGNMHWGHAVSRDLVHWEELPDALHPDELGTIFSGSAVIDYDNTAGFNKKNEPALVAAYTVDNPEKQRQCIAYSLDKGRTFTKYEGNPVIDSKAKWNSKDTRDPKVFWYAPGKHWVMVLNERDGHSIYNSADLKNWEYKSHVTGFWECPELFELPVDGDKNHTKWVMYGASGTYMLGSFDGQTFTPEAGKYYYYTGSMYAAQTYSNIPASDGRRIQIGWGRISHDGMPFNGMMLLPNELTLRTTSKGVRLFSVPVRETEQLFQPVGNWTSLSSDAANQRLQAFSGKDCLRIRTTIKLSHATSAGLNLYGQSLVDYDMNSNLINGVFYSPDDRTSMELTADIYIDRTSIEVFIDGGAYSYSMKRSPREGNREGLHFWGNNIEVKNLEVFSVKSIW